MTNFNHPDSRDRGVPAHPDPAHQTAAANQSELSAGRNQRPTTPHSTVNQDASYWQGRYSERNTLARQRAAEEEGAASGVIFGILLASLASLALGTYFYLNGQNRTPPIAPNSANPSPAPVQSPQIRERVIERDRIVPVPQPAPDTPDVNITIPSPAPAPATTNTMSPAPAPSPEATQPPAEVLPAPSGQ